VIKYVPYEILKLLIEASLLKVTTYILVAIEIWAAFGPVVNTEKKMWHDYEQL
jgi:hypothetical protein